MHLASCPSCGAPVEFKSFASVMAVCSYCKTTVLKTADTVKNLGRMADVLEDHSPIQIGTAGIFGARAFTVIGRIQLQYPAGLWNEWYLLFADGQDAWLGDFSGQFTLTVEKPCADVLSPFDALRPARRQRLLEQDYTVAEVRTAHCTGGAGELPFVVGQGWQAQLADLRDGSRFATIDYSDAARPRIHIGQAVSLEALHCQFLRDDDTVRASAGRIRSPVTALDCPSCGSQVAHVPGVTREIVCPSCHARVDITTYVAQVLAVSVRVKQIASTLELGAKATINGASFELIGLLRRTDNNANDWTEYLLYHPRAGLLWLIETQSGWYRSRVLDEWPQWEQHQRTARLGAVSYRWSSRYTARVTFAAGAFNWRVAAGEVVETTEFEAGNKILVAELTADELTWSSSAPVAGDQLKAWFGAALEMPAGTTMEHGGTANWPVLRTARFACGALALLNMIPLLDAFGNTWLYLVFGMLSIIVPALWLHATENDTE
ncbi:MAG: DUF4178 domain-containing protein [Janthinobacterium lividum]